MRRLLAGVAGAAVVLTLAGATPATASVDALQVRGFVVSAQCQGGDFALVSLSAQSRGGSGTVMYRWDFTNDGSFDTRPSPDPNASHLYPDESVFTARVGARDSSGATAQDTVQVVTPRCP